MVTSTGIGWLAESGGPGIFILGWRTSGMSHDHADLVDRSVACGHVLDLRKEVLRDQPRIAVAVDEISNATLATDVVADEDQPADSHATMDGFAFDAESSYPYEVVDREVFPEDDPGSLEAGQAVRIATGAPLPAGANAVLKREEATVEDGKLTGPSISAGTYVYERGSNVEAGELLYENGERLAPRDAILLRDLGYETVDVYDRFSVAILATGTEIHEGRHRDLDSPMLSALVRSWGHGATIEGSVPDDPARVRERVRELAEEKDVVVTTGGTSVGHKDHVISALASLGEVVFHRVRIRPGKPIAAARLPDQDAVAFAIPGKPIGAHVISTLVMRPFFTGNTGEHPAVDANVTCDLDVGAEGFEYVVPVELDAGRATPLGHASSSLSVYDEVFDPSVLSSSTRATRADGFFVTESGVEEGERVRVVPYPVVE